MNKDKHAGALDKIDITSRTNKTGLFMLKLSVILFMFAFTFYIFTNISNFTAAYFVRSWLTLFFALFHLISIFILYPIGQILILLSPERFEKKSITNSLISFICFWLNITVFMHNGLFVQ